MFAPGQSRPALDCPAVLMDDQSGGGYQEAVSGVWQCGRSGAIPGIPTVKARCPATLFDGFQVGHRSIEVSRFNAPKTPGGLPGDKASVGKAITVSPPSM